MAPTGGVALSAMLSVTLTRHPGAMLAPPQRSAQLNRCNQSPHESAHHPSYHNRSTEPLYANRLTKGLSLGHRAIEAAVSRGAAGRRFVRLEVTKP